MYIKQHTEDLLDLIKYSIRDKTLELEMIVKEQFEKSVTNEMFNNVVSRVKGHKDIEFKKKEVTLDISFADDFENLRVTIIGDENITNYCQTNDIKSIDMNYVVFLKKTPVRFVNVNDYNIKFNLKREVELSEKDTEILELLRNWTKIPKLFRYKKRMSYGTKDKLFNFDLTVTKTSNKKTVRAPNKIYKKKDVRDYMKKYIVKPDYIVDVNDWFSKLSDNDNVELIGKKFDKIIPFKSIQKSGVFINQQNYEIELEYIGNKFKNSLKPKDILIKMLQNTIILLQAVQKSYFIISESEKRKVIDNYKMMFDDYRFKGPQNVTLEQKHVIESEYSEYSNAITIRKGYTVTDKADGERNLLIVLEDGGLYLMNRKNTVRTLNSKCVPLANSIFDCEYIVKDKENKNVNYLMIFDIYMYNNKDLRNRILNRSNEEKMEGKIDESRFEVLEECMKIFESSLEKPASNNLEIMKKKFYYGDDDTYSEEVDIAIKKLKEQLTKFEKESEEYKSIEFKISELKSDTKIFDEAKKLYEKDYPYKIDGLVFTPRNLMVGEMPGIEQKNMFDGRWYRCFKWKPPEENTIDFLVKFKKDPDNEENDLITYKTIGTKVVKFKTLVLHVGYNPQIHTKYNSCRVLNENLLFDNTYTPVTFHPFQPYIKDIHYAHLEVKNDSVYCFDNNIINENNIVEFGYDGSNKDGLCWKPLKVRDTLTPNDFVTATNVWNSIHFPVSLDMITTGKSNLKTNIYYTLNLKRTERKTKSMNDFHSFVKKNLILQNLQGDKNVLDLGVGKGGDLNHYLDGSVNVLVGIDDVFDNLSNTENGMCNRILNKSVESSDLLEKTLSIWADGQKNIVNGDAGNDDLNKYYLNIIYGNVSLDLINNSKLRQFYNLGNSEAGFGFDLVSCQFAVHYFFKNIETLKNMLNNVSKSLKSGGRFIGTCFNGDLIFKNLLVLNEIGVDKLWKIKKLYSDNVFPANETSLGYEIEVFNETIGVFIKEYLVNFDFFETIAKEYNLNLIETKNFRTYFNDSKDENYGSMKKMSEELKEYSFLNTSFIFEKV